MTKTKKVRMVKDKASTRMLMLVVIEDHDTPFKINKCLVTTPLYLLSLQNKVHLCDHLSSMVEKKLVGMQLGFSAAMAEGDMSSLEIAQVSYKAPCVVTFWGEPWL